MRTYRKKHVGIAPIAHFIAQPSGYSQRILSLSLKKAPVRGRLVHFGRITSLTPADFENAHARVAYERGRTLESLRGTAFLRRKRGKILEELAGLVVDHMRLGVVHGDLHAENVIVSKSPLALKAIDYTGAVPLAGRFLGPYVTTYPTWDYHSVRMRLLPAIARDAKELERLKRLFEKRFLEKMEKEL